MFLIVAPLAFITLYRFRKIHKDSRPFYLGILGLGLLLSGMIMGDFLGHDHKGEATERILTVIGSILLFVGHWLNIKKANHCGVCHEHH